MRFGVGFFQAVGEKEVCLQYHAALARDFEGIAAGGERDLGPRSAQKIDGSDGFDFLETVGQKRESGFHSEASAMDPIKVFKPSQ